MRVLTVTVRQLQRPRWVLHLLGPCRQPNHRGLGAPLRQVGVQRLAAVEDGLAAVGPDGVGAVGRHGDRARHTAEVTRRRGGPAEQITRRVVRPAAGVLEEVPRSVILQDRSGWVVEIGSADVVRWAEVRRLRR